MIRRATIVAVGSLRGWAAEGAHDYLKRLRRSFAMEVIDVAEEDLNRRTTAEVLEAETRKLLKKMPTEAYVIALDRERGDPLSSEKLAQRLDSLGLSGRSHVVFVLGGSLGLSPKLLREADELISFVQITLPHALARVVLLEQLYRASKISRGEKYHY